MIGRGISSLIFFFFFFFSNSAERERERAFPKTFAKKMSGMKVFARVRPLLPGEEGELGLELETGSESSVQIKGSEEKYFYDKLWGPNTQQRQVFDDIGSTCINEVMSGKDVTIMAYGQTGTGKTHTLGSCKEGQEGIRPMISGQLFERVNSLKSNKSIKVSVVVEYIQIYREQILDLLNTKNNNLPLRASSSEFPQRSDKTRLFVAGNTKSVVTTATELNNIIIHGDTSRITANTKSNTASSRSHSVFIVSVSQSNESSAETTLGRLFIVDLAGSERPTQSSSSRAIYKEAIAINKSLTVLGTCVYGLANHTHVPYRDSSLTRLLQHCLGGSGSNIIILTLHPLLSSSSETSSTLNFGKLAMRIRSDNSIESFQQQVHESLFKASVQLQDYACSEASLKGNIETLEHLEEEEYRQGILLEEKEAAASQSIQNIKKELMSESEATINGFESQLSEFKAKVATQIQALHSNNAKQLTAAELKRRKEEEFLINETAEFKVDQDERLAEATKRLQSVREYHKGIARQPPDEQLIRSSLEEARNANAVLLQSIRDTTPSPYSHLTAAQLRRKVAHQRYINERLAAKARDLRNIQADQVCVNCFFFFFFFFFFFLIFFFFVKLHQRINYKQEKTATLRKVGLQSSSSGGSDTSEVCIFILSVIINIF